jgi:hypothetical protein
MKRNDVEGKRWFEQAQYDLKVSQWNDKGKLYAPPVSGLSSRLKKQ